MLVFSLLKQHNFPIPKFWIYHHKYGWINNKIPSNDILLISKPVYESASIGITSDSVSKFNYGYEKKIIELSQYLNQPIIVQEFIFGWEVEVPVFDVNIPVTLSTVGIEQNKEKCLNDKFLTYDHIYFDNYSFYNYDEENYTNAQKLKDIATNSYRCLDLDGSVRVDFRVDKSGQAFITDYNNSPHLTKFHSFAKSAEYYNLSYVNMFCLVLYKAMRKIID
ncbi:MAG: hypothetical protein KGV46_00080 [Pasteurella sp.]|nr:hypothetical protein [Pasteurella sp.]